MPSLGADMDEGTLLEWRVAPGDRVERGQIVALVDTDKAEIEIESFHAGTIEELLVAPGNTVPVGTPLARLASPALAPAAARAVPREAPPAPRPVAPPLRPLPEHQRVRATPRARRRAAELGIDLASLAMPGAGAAITHDDVERAARARSTQGPPAPSDRARMQRSVIAAAMARSKREIPHYYLGHPVDVTGALGWLEQHNAGRPAAARVLPAALFLKAVALAAREVPELNGFWREGGFQPAAEVRLGVAVSLRGGGLVAPVIPDVDRLGVDAVMQALRALVERARRGVLRSSDVAGATLTVTSLGEQGVETVYGVIHPPQVGLVGLGAVCERAAIRDGELAVRRILHASLSADHRASDGHTGARFLTRFAELLGRPEEL
jgi:pyruvate dehydrogenase E2 component (dihydrolipoamide acetyltransferase)